MTRRAEDDLVWRILEAENNGWEQWEKLTLQAIDRNGEPLRPEKYDLDTLESIKRSIWPLKRESLYQQQPVSEQWNIFKKEYFKYYSTALIESEVDYYSFLDPAISEKQQADYTSILTIAHHKQSDNIFVTDIFHERCGTDKTIDYVFYITKKYKHKAFGIETVAFQKMLAIEIEKEMTVRRQYFILEKIQPMGEKVVRIRTALETRYACHKIYHKPILCDELESELMKLPNGAHDDLADALSGAVSLVTTSASYHNNSNAYVSQVQTIDYSSIL